jgi:hypothetical protein
MGDAALGLLIANGMAILGFLVFAALGFIETTPDAEISLALTAVLQIPLWTGYLGVPIWASRTKGHGLVRDFGLRMRWYDVFLGLGVGIATQIVLALTWAPLADALGIDDAGEAAQELSDKVDGAAGVVLFIVIVSVCAPIIEEIFFRGLVLRSMENRWGSLVAVIGSGLLFGAIHLQPADLPPLAIVGIVLAWITVKTGRLGPAIWAHVFFNGTAAVVLLTT